MISHVSYFGHRLQLTVVLPHMLFCMCYLRRGGGGGGVIMGTATTLHFLPWIQES